MFQGPVTQEVSSLPKVEFRSTARTVAQLKGLGHNLKVAHELGAASGEDQVSVLDKLSYHVRSPTMLRFSARSADDVLAMRHAMERSLPRELQKDSNDSLPVTPFFVRSSIKDGVTSVEVLDVLSPNKGIVFKESFTSATERDVLRRAANVVETELKVRAGEHDSYLRSLPGQAPSSDTYVAKFSAVQKLSKEEAVLLRRVAADFEVTASISPFGGREPWGLALSKPLSSNDSPLDLNGRLGGIRFQRDVPLRSADLQKGLVNGEREYTESVDRFGNTVKRWVVAQEGKAREITDYFPPSELRKSEGGVMVGAPLDLSMLGRDYRGATLKEWIKRESFAPALERDGVAVYAAKPEMLKGLSTEMDGLISEIKRARRDFGVTDVGRRVHVVDSQTMHAVTTRERPDEFAVSLSRIRASNDPLYAYHEVVHGLIDGRNVALTNTERIFNDLHKRDPEFLNSLAESRILGLKVSAGEPDLDKDELAASVMSASRRLNPVLIKSFVEGLPVEKQWSYKAVLEAVKTDLETAQKEGKLPPSMPALTKLTADLDETLKYVRPRIIR